MKKRFFVLFILFSLCGCSHSKPVNKVKGEYIYRHYDEKFVKLEPMAQVQRAIYPWEESQSSIYSKITKDFFRCRGSQLNPVVLVHKNKEIVRFYDCGGAQKHSLPLRDQKEFIYPVLIDLLNYIQTMTAKRVVVTCGHCCPEHNAYLNPDSSHSNSKHMLGAEVDFYVQEMEEQPEKLIALIETYYKENSKYTGLKEYQEFKTIEKENKNPVWMNKEILVKIFKKNEGRDFDNRHPYAYITIQVRHDWDLNEQVNYSWDKAFRNFHRR